MSAYADSSPPLLLKKKIHIHASSCLPPCRFLPIPPLPVAIKNCTLARLLCPVPGQSRTHSPCSSQGRDVLLLNLQWMRYTKEQVPQDITMAAEVSICPSLPFSSLLLPPLPSLPPPLSTHPLPLQSMHILLASSIVSGVAMQQPSRSAPRIIRLPS